MGFRVLGRTEELLKGFGPRRGLEGPFLFGTGRVLYYDNKAGQYWDPRTDFYVEQEELDLLHREMMRMMTQ